MYYYYYHSKKYPDDVIVYVEEVNKEENYVIIDFLNTDQHRKFTSLLNFDSQIDKTSMVLIRNYYPRKRIQENTAYSINKNKILEFNNLIAYYGEESNLFKYQIDLAECKEELFSRSVSMSDLEKPNDNSVVDSYHNLSDLKLNLQGNLQLNVRNVGLANWNELLSDGKVVIVFDAGAPTFASKESVRNIIGDKVEEYFKSKPILILSHWDKDHYHSLIEMKDDEIKCFSYFICIDRAITNMTNELLNRFKNVLGFNKVIQISNYPLEKGRKTPLFLLSKNDSQLLLFTSMYHKNKNISGLVLAIRTLKSSAVFSGDCFYSQLSDYVIPLLNYTSKHNLIVPHHGGQAGKFIYETNKCIKSTAVISAGKSKKHPSAYYSDFLKKEFEYLWSTKKEERDICIDL